MIQLFFFFLFGLFPDHSLTVHSTAFPDNSFIPAKYTCSGANVNPPLTVSNIPSKAKSLALVMDDPDAPNGTFDHWVMWNISTSGNISEKSSPGKEGLNGQKENKYTGPCPPSGTHHYHFKVYALDTRLDLKGDTDKKALEKAMEGHVLATGELIGLFSK